MQFVQFGCVQYSVFPLEQNMHVTTKPPHLHMKYGCIYLFMGLGWTVSLLTLQVTKGRWKFKKKIQKKIQEVDTYMELNMPIKAVKQKPMANMDFIRTCKQKGQRCLKQQAHIEVLWAHTLKKRLCTDHWNQQGKRMTQKTEGLSKWLGKSQRDWEQRQPQCGATDGKCCFRETKQKSAQELPSHLAWAVLVGFFIPLSL